MTIRLELTADTPEELLQALKAIQRPTRAEIEKQQFRDVWAWTKKVIGPGISPNHLPASGPWNDARMYQSWAGVPRENVGAKEAMKGFLDV